jgi:hypothetical protein
MKKLAWCVALAALATSAMAMANEHGALADDAAASPHRNDAALKTMVDHALSASRKEDASAGPAKRYFDADLQPAR